MSYKIIYTLSHKTGNFSKEEVMKEVEKDPEHIGATDALIVVSVLKNESGCSSTAIVSVDGETNTPMNDTDLFKAWSIMAHSLMETNIPQWQKKIAKNAFEAVKMRIAP